jgi:aryl-alcohol dehydrogenase-like predicted oxidoreductase
MIPRQPFGRTGHESTRAIFGAAALAQVSQEEADRALERLFEFGVNHIDVAAAYGEAELRIGPWMARHRDGFFLATKTGERSYAGAREEIRRSLERLRVERLDLIQLHNLVDEDEWEEALGSDGALRAAVEAREEGLVRFIGVTGHGTRVAGMHLRSLERFEFDSVLLPYSYVAMQNAEYAGDFERLYARCREGNVAIQTIKTIARRRWPEGATPHRTTWYEPLEEEPDIRRAVHWALARPGIFVNTASDLVLLPRILRAARSMCEAPDEAEMGEAAARLEQAPLFIRGLSNRPPTTSSP